MVHHLTLEERKVVARMHGAGEIPAEIARRLGRAASTISRKLQRNRSRNGYWAVQNSPRSSWITTEFCD
jgi:IS30 family transposase